MKYLNNKVTGDRIVINTINIDSNSIKYSVLAANSTQLSSTKYTFSTIQLRDNLNTSTIYGELVLDTLKTELVLPDYEIETDVQNWLSPTKSMRFFIPALLQLDALREQTDFNDVMLNMIAASKEDADVKIIINSVFTTVYADSIDPVNESVITPLIESGAIVLELKK